jgi:hypothetical protein
MRLNIVRKLNKKRRKTVQKNEQGSPSLIISRATVLKEGHRFTCPLLSFSYPRLGGDILR